MVDVSDDFFFIDYRVATSTHSKDTPENKPEYNYITDLKSYFLNRAVMECNVTTNNIAWIDFGFNHGNGNEEDFAFLLKCGLSERITMFSLCEDERPLFEIIRTVRKAAITGAFFICPTNLSATFWTLIRECIFYLLDVGFMDDDQPVFLMASRISPMMFNFKMSGWFDMFVPHSNGRHIGKALSEKLNKAS